MKKAIETVINYFLAREEDKTIFTYTLPNGRKAYLTCILVVDEKAD
ncbi:hypothetical protein H0A36_29385 [Endozoicomonas sp. SM1973]|uniref:Uncharacterized protein n=1 Tax=Spartinivicinus marinus TaxID=2994442 RepID=A0A853I8A8_9GAMM|nr:hypothetical protein [Spartinivicinus marinus]MCX4024758.1 hypothetical protein [Spartinivicinus marinus]NYZ70130.1 hypothetical protein [Spartinivicinus marinus]